MGFVVNDSVGVKVGSTFYLDVFILLVRDFLVPFCFITAF